MRGETQLFEQTDLNLASLDDFLKFGLMAPGEHLFKSLNFETDSGWSSSGVDLEIENRSDIELAKDLYQALEESISDFVERNPEGAVALSGGADSRLILSILLKNHRQAMKSLYLYCRVHPQLGREQDRDVLLLNQISKKFDFHVDFEESKKGITNYLIPQGSGSRNILTGLWGGELLGGVLLTEFPAAEVNWRALPQDSPLVRFFQQLELSEQEFTKRRLAIFHSSLSRTSLSGFYSSYSWLVPSYFKLLAFSPFVDERFLRVLFSEESARFKDYKIYKTILLQNCENLLFVGVNNQSCIEDPRFPSVPGLDANQYASSSVAVEQEWTRQKQELKEYLEKIPRQKYSEYLDSILKYVDFSSLQKGVRSLYGR